MSAVGGQGAQGRQQVDRAPLVDSEVVKHTEAFLRDDPSLITVTHTPDAVTTHIVAADPGGTAPTVRMEQGRVVTKTVTADYGTVIAVTGGPAVVEIALHKDTEQRDRYLLAAQQVDAETRQHTLDAVQSFAMPIVLAVIQQLGVVDEATVDDSAQTVDEDPS